jgi:hypothetical protein
VPGGLRLLGEGFVYQEDNDPKHSSHLCRGYLERKEKLGRQMNSRLIIISKICYLSLGVLTRMVWPPQEPGFKSYCRSGIFCKIKARRIRPSHRENHLDGTRESMEYDYARNMIHRHNG